MKHKYPRPRIYREKAGFEPRALFKQPDRLFYRMPEMEMRDGRIIAEGCKRILEYTPDKLCVDFGCTITIFYGKSIKIELLAGKRLVIVGQILNISMSGAGDEIDNAQHQISTKKKIDGDNVGGG